ncbi:Acyl-CoA synthetase (AMP-forming)/AMP-acid ligase II [Geosmithia morbida]|uniref:Acyl-CoA synthetase (AMP-forming)/AMP-acid ligase II n=1 Tax=Geosmithia morbida TaxID=1094350 RepID=A0A9P5D7H9_9HYPO|nr:Acyl-CoA synthetase (AMP-forming)/AMP-acid ligase II [Geosmithia morbida]KAF4124534.1 Acyl-CoA synthetase (AMP-forming)/AMP-acid ligase II [Geosmithia morbida]
MVFHPPSWVPPLPHIPDDITLDQFLNTENYGRHALSSSRNPFTCGLTGKTYTAQQVVQRVDYLSRALGKRLSIDSEDGTEWDRVVCLFSLNTIDYIPFTNAIHRLNGIVTPASAAYSAPELEHQLRSSGARAVFTCLPLLDTALQAANAVGIPEASVFLLSLPGFDDSKVPFSTLDDLIAQGKSLPPVKPLRWIKGQGARQTAFLSYSSGTSGLPKAVMVSHRNVIANIIQVGIYDGVGRKQKGIKTQVHLGLLPLSHIYGLTLVGLLGQYRGDEAVILPRFELSSFLSSIQRFRIEALFIVPPILISMLSNKDKCDKTDMSSVRHVMSGAAPLGSEVVAEVLKRYPSWTVSQGYGMTEASPVVVTSSELDISIGSSGSLIPGCVAKIIDTDGNEVTTHETRGELLVQSPSVVLGYLHNEKANAETFVWHDDGRWLRTGDEVLVRNSSQGNEHFFIVDRIKELIKCKGHQVAPAELEAHLLSHPHVQDCTVIPVADDRSGEVPKAFVVRDPSASSVPDADLIKSITKHVEDHKANHKWLRGGVEFIDAIPKSPSGKILRRMLREKEKAKRKEQGAKL